MDLTDRKLTPSPAPPLIWLGRVVTLALAYYLTARVGQLMAIQPGNVTPFWPPSGIALAGVLFWGARVWPGIWAGSFAFNASFFAAQTDAPPGYTLIAVAIACGASVQVLVANWLVRRSLGGRDPQERGRDLLMLLALGGPIACLIAATIGTVSYILAGVISPAEFAHTWWTWWFGDTAGVLLVTPLALVWATKTPKHWIARAVGGAGVAASLALWQGLEALGDRATEQEFHAEAGQQVETFRDEFTQSLESLYSIRSFLGGSERVEREEFRTFAAPFLLRHPALKALSWDPRVADPERDAFEAAARGEGIAGYEITERDAGQTLVRARRRPEYFPVYYIEPRQPNQAVLGLDSVSLPDRLEAAERARDTGLPAATGRVRLVQTPDESGLLLFMPVYRGDPQKVEERREDLIGFAIGVFEIGRVVERVFAGQNHRGIDFSLFDSSAEPGETHLHTYGAATASDPAQTRSLVEKHRAPTGVHYTRSFDVGGRQWRVVCTPTEAYVASHDHWLPLWVLAFGLTLSGLLTRYLAMMADRAAVIQATNQELRREVLQRAAAELNYRDLYDHAPDLYCSVDTETGQVLECNQTLLHSLGLPRERVIGRHVRELHHPDSMAAAELALRELRDSGEVRNAELMLRRGDGSVMDVILNMTAVRDATGRIVQGRAVWREITELKLARVELEYYQAQLEETVQVRTGELAHSNAELARKNEKLTELYDTAHRFVDNVSHEFRTPLTVIKGYTDVLLGGIGGPLSSDQTEWLRLIGDRSRDLAQMVDDLLDTSKLRVGMMRVDRRPVTVQAIVDRVWPMLESKAQTNHITLRTRIGADLPRVYADAEKAGRVVVNLVVNAIKFSAEGATVTLSAERCGDGVEVSVIDGGPGISAENLRVIFERFKQVGDPQRSSTKGFGLGLNIAKELVALNLGEMGVASEPGKGSTFSFTLPADDRRTILDRYLWRLADFRPPGNSLALIRVSSPTFIGNEEQLCGDLASQGRPLDLILEGDPGSGAAHLLRVCDKPWESLVELEKAWAGLMTDRAPEAASHDVRFRLLKSWRYSADEMVSLDEVDSQFRGVLADGA